MKKIENKTTEMKKQNGVMTYGDLIRICIEVTPEKGFDVATMRLILKISDKLEGKTINLEDTEYDLVKTKVSEMKRAMVHKDIVQFEDDINK